MPPVEINEFRGINTVDPPHRIEDTQLVRAVNMSIGINGDLRVRSGFEPLEGDIPVDDTPATPTLLGVFKPAASVAKMIAVAGGKVWSTNGVDGWIEVGEDSALYTDIVQSNTKMYMGGGHSWDGTTFATVTGMPTHTIGSMVSHKSRLWTHDKISGVTHSRLYFSAPGDFDDWPAANFIDVGAGDGTIVQLKSFKDVLYVFKTTSVYVIYTSGPASNWILRKVISETGSVGKTVVEWNNKLYFVGVNGVYTFDGITLRQISDPINTIVTNGLVDTHQESAAIWKDRYIVWVTAVEGSEVKRILVWNIRMQAWTEWVIAEPDYEIQSFMAVQTGKDFISRDLFASFHTDLPVTTGRVSKYNGTSDNGFNLDIIIQTKTYDFENPLSMKRIKYCAIQGKIENAVVRHIGGDDSSHVIGDLDLVDKEFKLPGCGYTRNYAMEIVANNASDFRISGILMDVELKGKYADKAMT